MPTAIRAWVEIRTIFVETLNEDITVSDIVAGNFQLPAFYLAA